MGKRVCKRVRTVDVGLRRSSFEAALRTGAVMLVVPNTLRVPSRSENPMGGNTTSLLRRSSIARQGPRAVRCSDQGVLTESIWMLKVSYVLNFGRGGGPEHQTAN